METQTESRPSKEFKGIEIPIFKEYGKPILKERNGSIVIACAIDDISGEAKALEAVKTIADTVITENMEQKALGFKGTFLSGKRWFEIDGVNAYENTKCNMLNCLGPRNKTGFERLYIIFLGPKE